MDEHKQPEKKTHVKERTGLRFVNVEIEEVLRRRSLDVIVNLCNVDDETDVEEMTVLSFSSDIVKSQSIAYDFIEREVIHNLRAHGIAADMHENVLKEVESKLEHHGVRIDYY